MIRLVAESGGMIHGGLAQVGRVGATCATRSVTSWRALQLVRAALEDEPDRRELRDRLRPQLVEARRCPLSCSSIGTVISSSTSFEELPSAIVWISTCGGANSGNTSTFAFGICATPKTIIAVAANSTSHRNRRLLETIQRITPYPLLHQWLPAISSSVPYTSVGTDRHDLGAGGRPL